MIEQIVEYNKKFVENKGYEPYLTSKYPNKKLAVLTCMDTRLTELLPAALGLKNGDAKIIKNAGGVITHPYGSVVRSLLVAILELGVEQVMVIGHTDCGVQGMDGNELLGELVERGIDKEHIDIVFMCPVSSFGLNIYIINPVKHIEIVHINRSGVGFHRRKNIGHRDTQEFGFVPVDIKIQLRNFGL